MSFEDVETFGARTEIALENAYDEVEDAITDVAVSNETFDDVQDAYQEAVQKYGEATQHAYEAAKKVDQDNFGKEDAEEAVEHIMNSRDVADEAITAAENMLKVAHNNVPEVSRPEGTKDNGFPVQTPKDKLHEARNYVEDAKQNYGEAASTVEINISNETGIDYHPAFGLGGAPEGFDI